MCDIWEFELRCCTGLKALFITICVLTIGAAEARELETLRDIFTTLQRCWRPPPIDRAFAGMRVTVRLSLKSNGDLVGQPRITFITPIAPRATADLYRQAALSSIEQCLPLPVSSTLGLAVAGRPLTFQFIDARQKTRQATFVDAATGRVQCST